MDIAKTGNTSPDETSRPVIVKNRVVLNDPMVKQQTPKQTEQAVQTEEKINEPSGEIVTGKKTITPIHESNDSKASNEGDNTKPTDSVNNNQTSDDSENKEANAIVDAVVQQANAKSDSGVEAPDKTDQRQEVINKLVDAKTYFLPIGQVTRRKQTKQLLWLVVFLIILAAVYVAVDLELFALPFPLPFDLFR